MSKPQITREEVLKMVTAEVQKHGECPQVELRYISPDLDELRLGMGHSDPHGPSEAQREECTKIARVALKEVLERFELID